MSPTRPFSVGLSETCRLSDDLSLVATVGPIVTDIAPDAIYRCRECGQRFVDDQLAFERHAAAEHDHVRDVLPTILNEI